MSTATGNTAGNTPTGAVLPPSRSEAGWASRWQPIELASAKLLAHTRLMHLSGLRVASAECAGLVAARNGRGCERPPFDAPRFASGCGPGGSLTPPRPCRSPGAMTRRGWSSATRDLCPADGPPRGTEVVP